MPSTASTPRRIDQLLANLGYCSRREARAFVDAGRVRVKDKIADDSSAKVLPSTVQIEGEPLDHPEGLLIALNKPLGLVCSHDEREGPSVYSLLSERWRRRNPVITSIGRLDKETSGLLLLTDQAELVHRLTSPKHKVPKIYHATLDGDLPGDAAEIFTSGKLQLAGEAEPCAPAGWREISPRVIEVTLTEGRYHQVRRMFAAIGCTVVALHRTQFGGCGLFDLAPAQWRELPIDFFAVK